MKNIIDKELVERQLITSRTRAQELIESGYVKCNDKIIYKCNYLVSESDKLEIIKNDKLNLSILGVRKIKSKTLKPFVMSIDDRNSWFDWDKKAIVGYPTKFLKV